jgi:hypothetical protein
MRKTRTVLAMTGAVLALSAPAAMAASFSGSMTGSRVSGTVSISSTTASISGTVWDTQADGHCATLRGNWDIMWGPDHGFDVAQACGNGTHQSGSNSSNVDGSARDFEVRTKTGDDYKVVWEGNNGDA